MFTIHFIARRYRVVVAGYMAIGEYYRTIGGARIYRRALEAGRVSW